MTNKHQISFNKIIVIGCPGAGKTYFSNLLGDLINIPVYHLDDLYWEKDWKEKSKTEWIEIQKEILDFQRFIIDGNYMSTLENRIKKSELIIFLNKSVFSCLFGFAKRTLKNKFGKEINLPIKIKNQKNYKITENGVINFALYIIKFHMLHKQELINLLNKYNESKEIIVLNNRKDINNFFKEYINEQ